MPCAIFDFRQVELDPSKEHYSQDGYQFNPLHVSSRLIGPSASNQQPPTPFTMAAACSLPLHRRRLRRPSGSSYRSRRTIITPVIIPPSCSTSPSMVVATVRAQVVEATAQQKAVGLVAVVNGKLQPFFLPFTIKPAACLGNGRGLIHPQQGAHVLG